jgi:hypothetical protein
VLTTSKIQETSCAVDQQQHLRRGRSWIRETLEMPWNPVSLDDQLEPPSSARPQTTKGHPLGRALAQHHLVRSSLRTRKLKQTTTATWRESFALHLFVPLPAKGS